MNFIYLFVCIAFFTNCTSYKIKDFDQFKSVKTTLEEPMQKEIRKSLVIVPFTSVGGNAQYLDTGNIMGGLLENIFIELKYIKIEDRNKLEKLKNEIVLHEMSDSKNEISYPKAADYAIMGKVINIQNSYSSKIDWLALIIKILNKGKGNDLISHPEVVVKLDGSIKIVELPSLKTVKEFTFSSKASRRVQPNTASTSSGDGITLRRAIIRAIDSYAPKIINSLPLTGKIIDKMIHEGVPIFQINLGSENGIKLGQSIKLSRYSEDKKIKVLPVKSAYVSDIIEPDTSWLVIKDSDEYNRVKIGDAVSVFVKYTPKAQGSFADILGLDVD